MSYANKVNQKYSESKSNFVTLQQRFTSGLNTLFEKQLLGVIEEFKRRHKKLTKFADMHLCEAIMVPMDKILIDTTMQRAVNFVHILKILVNFKETMVMAIQVYEDPARPGYYIAWDGQHTAVALYIIATKVFGERVAKLMVPIVKYNVSMRAEIRRNFLSLNGDAKEPLEPVDIYQQQVYGVRIDGEDDEEWVATEQKQKYLEEVGLFVTNSKFEDHEENGAFTLLADTIMSSSAKTRKPVDATKMFTDYWSIAGHERPVDPKEARQLYEYFTLCIEDKEVTVDEGYILEFVSFCKEYFDSDFSANGPFWDKVKLAYDAWWIPNNPDAERNKEGNVIVRGFTKEARCGLPFLIAQLKHSTSLKTPRYDAPNGFKVAVKDLWEA